ncbi:MAG: ion transporter [Planctomycetes bacterium]|nr:ion transporter [Planctomycetota bacterium]MCA8935971.1 ion transporter [Planctomycetota bacterium]
MEETQTSRQVARWRERLHEVIFEADTPAGKAFDVVLLVLILGSILAVMLESVPEIASDANWRFWLRVVEWTLTGLFAIEYALRLICVRKPWRYARSFYGVVDLLAILPAPVSLLFPGTQSFAVIRAIRLLRAFRIFKLAHFLTEANQLRRALVAAWPKIAVFLMTVLVLVVIVGSAMYVIEGPEAGFTSIPLSMYWAVVTITTVGYGDIAPQTPFGKAIAALMMICGYALIVVPTGVLSAELAKSPKKQPVSTQACPSCGAEGHDSDARFCRSCGEQL